MIDEGTLTAYVLLSICQGSISWKLSNPILDHKIIYVILKKQSKDVNSLTSLIPCVYMHGWLLVLKTKQNKKQKNTQKSHTQKQKKYHHTENILSPPLHFNNLKL